RAGFGSARPRGVDRVDRLVPGWTGGLVDARGRGGGAAGHGRGGVRAVLGAGGPAGTDAPGTGRDRGGVAPSGAYAAAGRVRCPASGTRRPLLGHVGGRGVPVDVTPPLGRSSPSGTAPAIGDVPHHRDQNVICGVFGVLRYSG